jgi:hypothetical protein
VVVPLNGLLGFVSGPNRELEDVLSPRTTAHTGGEGAIVDALTRPGERLTALSCTHQGSLGNSARVEAEKKGVKHAQAGSILILKKKKLGGLCSGSLPAWLHARTPSLPIPRDCTIHAGDCPP